MTQPGKTLLKSLWSLFRTITWPSPAKAESAEKYYSDEMEAEEPISDHKRRLKTEMYYKILDFLQFQLKDWFPDHCLKMVQHWVFFLIQNFWTLITTIVKTNNIEDLCMYYKWDVDAVAEEINIFSEVYKVIEESINVTDDLGGMMN